MNWTALLPATVLALGGPCLAQEDARIDPDSGRELANWPPDTPFDHLHMRMDLDIPSMDVPEAHAVLTLRVAARGRARDTLTLDADRAAITITKVEARGRPVSFRHDGRKVHIDLRPPVAAGQEIDVVLTYDVAYRNASGAGLTWTPGKPDGDNATAQSAQIHSQGQPESNHTWFPCHDFPNERLTSQLVVTADSTYQVCANGRLASKKEGPDGRTTWNWMQEKSHPAYLVLLVIGRFDVVDIGGPESERPGIPMQVYAPIGQGEIAAEVCSNTPAMMAFFEARFDEPYPWAKYDQLFVRNFAAGGMENTSATTLTPGVLVGGSPAFADSLVAHELAHQWFADMVGYKSWEHLWLGEGWASYAEALWDEHAALTREPLPEGRPDAEGAQPEGERTAPTPEQRSVRAYQRTMLRYMRQQRGASSRSQAPEAIPMVSNRYANPDVAFFKPENVYSRGACVLHMLRERLGDEAFFAGVALYLDRHALTQVETDDFRHALEDASGQSLERFFDQWVYRAGLPKLRVGLDWDDSTQELVVACEQVQTIDDHNPAYALSIPIRLKFEGEDAPARTVWLDTDRRQATARFPMPARPIDAVVDPTATHLTDSKITKPLAMWLEQADDASLFAQAEAVEALRTFDATEARAALARLASDASRDPLIRDLARADEPSRLTTAR